MKPLPVMNCPCCQTVMRYNEWDRIHVCRCQGTLMELSELQAVAKNGTSSGSLPLPLGAGKAVQVNPHLAPQAAGSAQVQLPTTEFLTIAIKNLPILTDFYNKNKYNFDFKSRVWFKKVRATNYPVEKQILDRHKVDHEVLPA